MWRKEDVVRHETYIMGLLPEFQANKIPASTVLFDCPWLNETLDKDEK